MGVPVVPNCRTLPLLLKIYLRFFLFYFFFEGETVTALYALQRFSCCTFVFVFLRDTSITVNMPSLHLQIAKAYVLMPEVFFFF